MKTVGVIFGGASTEHEVSCRSAYTILGAIPGEYKKVCIGIDKAGVWYYYYGDEAEIPTLGWEKSREKKELRFATGKNCLVYDGGELCVDVFFPVLHGKNGEDGTVQGLFELLGVPYVGCGVCSSAVSMDKSMTKRLVDTIGVRQAKCVFVDRYNKDDVDALIREAREKLGYPVFVKPCRSGSSVGVVKATDDASLSAGIRDALHYDDRLLLEEGIDARELECAVLGEGNNFTAEVGEVIPGADFYDYDAKYNSETSETNVTPDIPEHIRNEVRDTAIRIFRLLDCRGLARVDFFLDKKSGEVVFNEINTMPGFTSISMYPMLIGAAGIDVSGLVDRLIREALR